MPNLLEGRYPSDDDFLSEVEQQALILRIDIVRSEENINAWEEGFLDSCLQRVRARRNLSDRQFEILERIEVEAPLRLISREDSGGGYEGVF